MKSQQVQFASSVCRKMVHLGLVFALFSILFGFSLGIFFGVAEDSLKNILAESADLVFDEVYFNNKEKQSEVLSKSWSYLKRAHMHSGAIGASALASIACVAIFSVRPLGVFAGLSSLLFGFGGFVYGIFWLSAGFIAPSLGSTSLAKEYYEILGMLGGGSATLGVLGLLLVVLFELFRLKESNLN